MSVQEILVLQCKMLVVNYVSNQMRMGKIQSMVMIVVVGNGDGWVGLGYVKSQELMVVVMKVRLDVISKMRLVRRYENRMIFGNVEVKVLGMVVKLFVRLFGMFFFFDFWSCGDVDEKKKNRVWFESLVLYF